MKSGKVKFAFTLYACAVLIGALVFYTTDLFSNEYIVLPDCDFGIVPAGETSRIEIAIKNPTSQPIQFIGAEGYCTLIGCFWAEGLPITIPARQSGDITIVYKAGSAGQDSSEIVLYTDNPKQTMVRLQLHIKVAAKQAGVEEN